MSNCNWKGEVCLIVTFGTLLTGLTFFYYKVWEHESQRYSLKAIENNRAELNKTMCLEDVPEAYMSKWIADKSKFKGFDEFVRIHEMEEYQALHYERSRAVVEIYSETEKSLKIIFHRGQHSIDVKLSGECVYNSENSGYIVYMKHGILHVKATYFSKQGQKNTVTFVYRIEDADLL